MAKSKSGVVKIKIEWVPVEVAKRVAEQEDAGLTACGVCGEPVELESCKTNEYGKAVHQNCYIASILQAPRKKLLRSRAR